MSYHGQEDTEEEPRAPKDVTSHYKATSHPLLSEDDKEFILESHNRYEALFDLANIFRVPVTNNTPPRYD